MTDTVRRIIPHAPGATFAGTVLYAGEVVVDETTGRLITGDGVTVGGFDPIGSIVNLDVRRAINASATLSADDVGTCIDVGATAVADFQITLPAGVPTGSLVPIFISPACSKLVAIFTGSGTIDGLATRIMWAGEWALLRKTDAGWAKQDGWSRAFSGRLKATASTAGSTTATTWKPVDLAVAEQDASGFNLCFDAAGKQFKAARPSTFRFTINLPYTLTASDASQFYTGIILDGDILVSAIDGISVSANATGRTRITALTTANRLSTVNPAIRFDSGTTAAISADYSATVRQATLEYIEAPQW